MSSSLGSKFPKTIREDFCDRTIHPGSVLRIHVSTTTPPKTKRLVILAISGNIACVGYLLINSEINPKVFPTAALRELHFPLESGGRDYLEHDSYLDCSDIKNMDLGKLKENIAADPSIHIGSLCETDFEIAKEIVKNAPTISKNQKEKYALL